MLLKCAHGRALLKANEAACGRSTKAKKWNWKSSDYLCAEIAEHTDKVLLSFSMGKDSIAAYIQLKRFFKNVHLYYLYLAPNIPFIDQNIRYWFCFTAYIYIYQCKQIKNIKLLAKMIKFAIIHP
jgi:hypothetical protein